MTSAKAVQPNCTTDAEGARVDILAWSQNGVRCPPGSLSLRQTSMGSSFQKGCDGGQDLDAEKHIWGFKENWIPTWSPASETKVSNAASSVPAEGTSSAGMS